MKPTIIARNITFLAAAFLSSNVSANQFFGQDQGWLVSSPEQPSSGICSAQKSVNGLNVTIQEIFTKASNHTLLTVEKLPHQIASGPLEITLDSASLTAQPSNYAVNPTQISILLTDSMFSLSDIGLSETLRIGLRPHIGLNIDSPNYAMYLLSECNSRLKEQNKIAGSGRLIDSILPEQKKVSKVNRVDAQPAAPGAIEVDFNNLPPSFADFVRAFTITDDDSLKFISLAEARETYSDWVDAGWTGDEEFIMGIGTEISNPATEIFSLWTENRRENCEGKNGKFLTVDAGERRAGDFSGYVNYMLCERNDTWHYLTLLVVKDAQPPSYGLIEARSVHDTNLKAIRNWILSQKK